MEDSRRSTTTIASSTTVLIISNKLNCFITSRSLYPTFIRNYPATMERVCRERTGRIAEEGIGLSLELAVLKKWIGYDECRLTNEGSVVCRWKSTWFVGVRIAKGTAIHRWVDEEDRSMPMEERSTNREINSV